MKKIQILGLGCPKCEKLYESVKQAAKELGIEYEIEKIDDINKIFDMGAMTTLQDGGARTCVRSCPLKAQSTHRLWRHRRHALFVSRFARKSVSQMTS